MKARATTLLLFNLCLFLVFQFAQANEGTIALVNARIIDGTGAIPIETGTLVITDGRIRAVGGADVVTVPNDALVIDARGQTIMPGMVNAHAHVGGTLGLQGGNYTSENLIRQLHLYARYGITTVYSLGGDQELGFNLRDSQYRQDLDRARLYVAGIRVNGESAEHARGLVNQAADQGADIIKTSIDDNLGQSAKPDITILEATIEQAHARRLPVAVHLYYLEDAKAVLRAGADIIAHSVRDQLVDEEFLNLLQETGACYIPTLTREISTFAYETVPDFFSDPFFLKAVDPAVIQELSTPERQARYRNSASAQQYKIALQTAMSNLDILQNRGIAIAMGSDTGPPARFQGYFEHMELWLMVEAGLSPMQAIVAATGQPAACMNQSDIGTLEPGNWADFVVMDENPLENIRNTRSINSVWIAGNRVLEE